MNVSVNDTPFCYTINNPPFNYTHPIASAYYPFIFMTLGLTSNLIALVVLVKSFRTTQSRSRSSFLIFLGGLVVTDFMGLLVTGCIVGTFHVTHFNWRTLDPHCHFCNFMGMTMVFYGLCPLLLGATMAMERFIGITMPFVRSFSKKRGRTIYIVLSVWTFAGSIALLPVLGVGSFHLQKPGSWCFINISPEGTDMVFSLIFSLTGLTCITVSFLLNTVSLVTLIRVCCGHDRKQRRRDYEIEMMVQLILIMVIASICWCPLLINTLLSIVTMVPVRDEIVLFCIRMATCNQIFDPWIYIVCQVPCLRSLLRKLCFLEPNSKPKTFCWGCVLPLGTRSWTPGSTSSFVGRSSRDSIPGLTGPVALL